MKNLSNSPASKKDIEKARDELKGDIKTVKDELKGDIKELDDKIEKVEKSLRLDIQFSIKETEERLDDKARQYRDQILTKMDKFMGEIKDSREERILVAEKQTEHTDQIERLEKDVDKLKSSVFPQ